MKREALAEIVRRLREQIEEGLTNENVADAYTDIVRSVGSKFAYDKTLYPALNRTKSLSMGSIDKPVSVAEAFIWKQGDWKKYQNFVGWYYDGIDNPPNKAIVHYAFAKHLRHPDRPIFDQHTLRALWALADALWDEPGEPCRHFLMRRHMTTWKAVGGGNQGANCYNLFVAEFQTIVAHAGLNRRNLDRMLMSLGRALKNISAVHTAPRTTDYDEFCDIIGR